jgi:transcriptional regulator with XRE-family HTH domain
MNIKDVKINLPSKEKLAEAIKRLQYVKGVTNVELAKLLGVTTMTVGNIRNGLSSYERMAEAFHTLEKLKRK